LNNLDKKGGRKKKILFFFPARPFLLVFQINGGGAEGTRFAPIIFVLTGEGKRWMFVDFLSVITRFLKMGFYMRENGSRGGIFCFV